MQDNQLRVVMVETAGSRALAALQEHNTISDPRFVVATSARPSALMELAQKGLPCSCIALESISRQMNKCPASRPSELPELSVADLNYTTVAVSPDGR